MNGSAEYSLHGITQLLERGCGRTPKSSKTLLDLSLSDFVEEFFTGVTHDKNMVKMAKFFESDHTLRRYLLDNDFFAKKGLKTLRSMEEDFKKKVEEKDVEFPIFSNYKMVSLD